MMETAIALLTSGSQESLAGATSSNCGRNRAMICWVLGARKTIKSSIPTKLAGAPSEMGGGDSPLPFKPAIARTIAMALPTDSARKKTHAKTTARNVAACPETLHPRPLHGQPDHSASAETA